MIPFEVTDWETIPATNHPGETGTATWKTMAYGHVRVRVVKYSPDYKADHWCSKGHIVFCMEGEFTSHMKDGSQYILKKGMSYQVSDNEENPHRSTSEKGCTLFITDGDFLTS